MSLRRLCYVYYDHELAMYAAYNAEKYSMEAERSAGQRAVETVKLPQEPFQTKMMVKNIFLCDTKSSHQNPSLAKHLVLTCVLMMWFYRVLRISSSV